MRKRSRGPAEEVGREAGETGRDAGETGRDAGKSGRDVGETGRDVGVSGREVGETGRGIGTSGALPESGTDGIGPEVIGSSGRRPSSSAAPCRVA